MLADERDYQGAATPGLHSHRFTMQLSYNGPFIKIALFGSWVVWMLKCQSAQTERKAKKAEVFPYEWFLI